MCECFSIIETLFVRFADVEVTPVAELCDTMRAKR